MYQYICVFIVDYLMLMHRMFFQTRHTESSHRYFYESSIQIQQVGHFLIAFFSMKACLFLCGSYILHVAL